MTSWLRGPSVLSAVLVLAACAGTETDNPVAGGDAPSYRSPPRFNPGQSDAPPGCPAPPDSGKPRGLPLWGRDGSLIVGADRYSGLRALDASDSLHPTVTAELALSGEPQQLLMQGNGGVALVIDELPELHQAQVPEPIALEAVTRLVRYDASKASALVRAGDVEVEGEFWRLVQHDDLTWVMSAKVPNAMSCDHALSDCGYVSRTGLILTAYRFGDGSWQQVQRVELAMNAQGWSTPEGFATFQSLSDVEGNATGGVLRAVRFEADGQLGTPVELHVPGQIAEGAPLSLANDQARVFVRDPHDGGVGLAIFDLASGELLSQLDGIGGQAGRETRFGAHAVYVADEGSQRGAVFIDTSVASAPVAVAFPSPITRALPLNDDGSLLLGVSARSLADGLSFSLLQQQDRTLTVLDNAIVPGAVAMPDADALWLQGGNAYYEYQRQDGSFRLGAIAIGENALTSLDIAADGYADEVIGLVDAVYVPDAFGLHVVPLQSGAADMRFDWNSDVTAYAVAGDYEAALVQRLDGPIVLELTRGDAVQRFDVSPGAQRLIADDAHVLVVSSEPAQQCAQSGLDCADYEPNVALYALGDSPHFIAQLPLPDNDLVSNDAQSNVQLYWDTQAQGLALGDGRYLFAAEFDGTCTSEAACAALGIDARPIGEAGVNVALPSASPPCPIGAVQCDQPEPTPAPTVYGEQRALRLYVLDARTEQPSFGALAQSVLELGASYFAPVRVSQGRVLVTRIEREPERPTPGVSSVPNDQARFMLERFELDDTGGLHALPALNVPGFPLALRNDGAVLTSVEPDATHEGGATLYRLALRDDGAHVLQKLALDARYGDVRVFNDAERAYFLREDGEGCAGSSELVPIALPDDEHAEFTALPSLTVPGVGWTFADARDGRLLLSSEQQRFAVIDLGGAAPTVDTFIASASYMEQPQLNGDAIVGAGSLWGKQHLAL